MREANAASYTTRWDTIQQIASPLSGVERPDQGARREEPPRSTAPSLI
jgi:hypothetical protein